MFLLSGLWHGAAWTFVVWGACHGIAYVLERPWRKLPVKHPWLGRIKTFALVVLFFSLFRSPDFGTWVDYIRALFSFGQFAKVSLLALVTTLPKEAVLGALAGLAVWGMRTVLPRVGTLSWGIVYLVVIFLFGRFSGQGFIYFQF